MRSGSRRQSAPVREAPLMPQQDPGCQEWAGVYSHHLSPTAASQDPAVLASGSRCLCVDAEPLCLHVLEQRTSTSSF